MFKIANNFRVLIVVVALLGGWFTLAGAAGVQRMPSDELHNRLGEENLVVLDARAHGDYERAKLKIAGAVRVDPRNVKSWADAYSKEQTIVLYCA